MKLLYFLLLVLHSCIVCNGVVARNISARPNVVNIGAFFSFNSTIGRAAKIAVEAAVNDVNSNSSVLGSTKLVVKMQDTNCSGFLGVVEGLQMMEEDIVAVIGPQLSVVAHVLSHVANELKVPMLSFSATDPTLTSLQYPFFLRTTQSDLFQMTAIADLVQYYNWNQVAVIYIDNDYGRNGVSVLGDKLAQRRCKISYKAKLPPVYTRRDVTDLLVKLELMESRVFVLHVNPDSGLTVLSVAHYLGMLGNGCVWIATDWLSSYLDSSVALQPESTSFMQGVIGFRQHIGNSSRKTAFISRWTKLVQKENSGNVGINSYALYAYDTVWMIARAVGAFLDAGGTISFSNASRLAGGNLNLEAMTVFDSGKILLDEILKTDMVGLTGPVHFDSNHDLVQQAYDIINVIGTGHRTIGYWSNYSGLSIVPPETLYVKRLNGTMVDHQLYSVIWPGETTSKPRGWVFPNNGKELKVGVPYRTSYKEFVTEVRGADNMKGFCIDVFTAAVGLLPYPVPYKFIPFGDGHKNPSYSMLVNMVASEEFDAAIGDITIVTNRTKIVDFTQPYIESGLVILAPVEKRNPNTWAFLQPFTLEMWCATGGFFIVVGAVIWILEHRLNDDFRGPPSRQLVTVIWFSFSTLFFAHKENTVSMLGRLVLIIWLFVVLIVQSSYTASLTSILTVQQLSSPIKGIDSLIASNAPIGFQVGSFAENYMVEELGISRSRLRSLGSPEDYARALELGPENGGVVAVVDERPYVDLFISTQCKYSVIGSEFTKSGWGFAFPRDSPLAVDMSTAILTLSENGDLHRIHNKWLSRSVCRTENELNSERLHLDSFYGLFLICGVAFVIALIIYFILVLRQFFKQLRLQSDVADPSEPGSSRSVRGLQSFLSFADEKEEDSKHRSMQRQLESSSSHGNDSRKACNGSELTTIL